MLVTYLGPLVSLVVFGRLRFEEPEAAESLVSRG